MIHRFSLGFVLLLTAVPALAQEAREAPPEKVSGQAVSAQAVSALGRLEPEQGIIRLSAPSTPQASLGAILAELHVDQGDDVEAGQLLAVTDTAAVMEAMVQEAEAGVAFAQKEVDARRSQAIEACVRANVAASEAQRRTRLHEQGVMGDEEAEIARGEAEARQASCASTATTVSLAETGVDVARAQLNRVRVEAQRSYIRAPFAGRVLDVTVRPGESIGERGILELGRVSRMHAVAEVYETDIRYVKVGQRASVSSPALEGALSGTVQAIRPKVAKQDEIGTDPAARKDARIVEVEILLDDAAPAAGLTNLQVDVVIQR
jgi:HlyD family secretion protein